MAWFRYKCLEHGIFTASLEQREKTMKCPKCGARSMVKLGVGTTQIVEKLDNGVQGRAVERLHNVEEIMEERNDKHTLEQPDEDEDN